MSVFQASMVINDLTITQNKMDISATISCPFNLDVTSPKVKINFNCNGKTRRLPFLINNYVRKKGSDIALVNCSYTFLLDNVFFNYDVDSDIKISFDFYYGEEEVYNLPFKVSTNVKNKNNDLNIDKNYIDYNSNNGLNIVTKDEEEFSNDKSKIIDCYSFNFDFENHNILVASKKADFHDKTFAQKSIIIVPLIRFVFFILRIALSIILAPYFIIDGFLAAFGVLPKRHTKKIDSIFKNIFVQIKINFSSFMKTSFKRSNIVNNIRKPIFALASLVFKSMSKKPIVENRIAFMSGRRDEIGGNPEFVYNLLKDDKDIDFQFLMFSDPNGHNKLKNIISFLKLYSTSKVVIVDDYFRLLNMVPKRDDVKLFQLWHACGAFKTFGFTRLGKKGGPKQTDKNHRMYDYAIVSSREIAKHYAEGFGISDENVVATGIPRTDIFMDDDYAKKVKESFYQKHPQLKNKKILLFAPTFRGNGQMSAFYPTSIIDLENVFEELKEEYAIIIKLHPFCKERFKIDEKYSDYIIDLSDEDELNDLLFVTDLLVTDYSSVVFEASLLNIPMLFYSYDLYDYISSRDFYYDYESFVPGKIVFSQNDLIKAISENNFESEKVSSFKTKFFDDLDGKSSQRVADLILDTLKK